MSVVEDTSDVDFKLPFIVRNSPIVTGITEDASNTMKGTFDRWGTVFETSVYAKKNDTVNASIMDQHGHGELLAFAKFLEGDHGEIRSANPELAKHIDRWDLFGHTPYFLNSDFEEHCMASLRLQVVGQTDMVLFPVTTAKAILKHLNKDRLVGRWER